MTSEGKKSKTHNPEMETGEEKLEATMENAETQIDSAVQNEINKLDELQEKCREIDELDNKYKRLQADYDNFRKRTQKEKEEISLIVTERIISELLPVIDNFERAINTTNKDAESIVLGVEMIYRQFISIFNRLGIEEIEALDCQFDPNQHEAVMRVEDTGKQMGTIVLQLQKGYKFKGRVIRPSMVHVAGEGSS